MHLLGSLGPIKLTNLVAEAEFRRLPPFIVFISTGGKNPAVLSAQKIERKMKKKNTKWT